MNVIFMLVAAGILVALRLWYRRKLKPKLKAVIGRWRFRLLSSRQLAALVQAGELSPGDGYRRIEEIQQKRRRAFERKFEPYRQVDDLLPWLPGNSGPDLWHLLVGNLNWDYESTSDVVLWIVQQPKCDLATAVAAVAAFDVDEFARFTHIEDCIPPRYDPRFWKIAETVCRRGAAGTYPGPRFNPRCLGRPNDEGKQTLLQLERVGVKLSVTGRALPWPVPAPMLSTPCDGRNAKSSRFLVNDDRLYRKRSWLARLRG